MATPLDRASAQHCTDASLRLVQRAVALRAEFGKDEDWRRLVSSFGAVYVRNLAAAFHPHQPGAVYVRNLAAAFHLHQPQEDPVQW